VLRQLESRFISSDVGSHARAASSSLLGGSQKGFFLGRRFSRHAKTTILAENTVLNYRR
jgi:hypothetical protein